MQQAVRVLYGQASPSEALEAATLELARSTSTRSCATSRATRTSRASTTCATQRAARPVPVRADEYSLEDVVTHILRNADRHRTPGTPITHRADAADGAGARSTIHNQGAPIDPATARAHLRVRRVRSAATPATPSHRGQGLFVARTYMAKMGGTIVARNEADGVAFVLTLPRA